MNNKKIIYIVAAAFLVAGVFFLVRQQRAREVKNYPSAGTDIVAFGDSLIVGSGASKPEKSFVNLLSQKAQVNIFNLGTPGDTTASGLARIHDLDRFHPKIVILLLGGNDRLRQVPEAETIGNLEKIIQNIQNRGAIVLLLGVKGDVFGDSFGKDLQKLADKYHTAYVPDVLDGLFGNSKYMADPIHPNDAGNQIIADRVYPVFQKLLK